MERAVVRFPLLICAVLATCAVGLAGCGTAAAPPAGPKVSLSLLEPSDQSRVSSTRATVSGTVKPVRARVQVLGRAIRVSPDGSFSVQVGLKLGTNLIDVEASLPRSVGAVAAVRVTRFQLVTVPPVDGDSPSQATDALKAAGFGVKTDGSANPLSFLIPGSTSVCSESPSGGTKVDPGATVTIHTSKLCGF